jgi:hypothetical protein
MTQVATYAEVTFAMLTFHSDRVLQRMFQFIQDGGMYQHFDFNLASQPF